MTIGIILWEYEPGSHSTRKLVFTMWTTPSTFRLHNKPSLPLLSRPVLVCDSIKEMKHFYLLFNCVKWSTLVNWWSCFEALLGNKSHSFSAVISATVRCLHGGKFRLLLFLSDFWRSIHSRAKAIIKILKRHATVTVSQLRLLLILLPFLTVRRCYLTSCDYVCFWKKKIEV